MYKHNRGFFIIEPVLALLIVLGGAALTLSQNGQSEESESVAIAEVAEMNTPELTQVPHSQDPAQSPQLTDSFPD